MDGASFVQALGFAQTIYQAFTISKDDTHIGLIMAGTNAQVGFELNQYTAITDIDIKVNALKGTRTTGQLRLDYGFIAAQKLFLTTGRGGVPNVLIVMMNGRHRGS